MIDETKTEPENSPSQRPRSPRVPVNFPVELEGRAPSGEPFKESGEAVRVSRGGATLTAAAAVEPGALRRLPPPPRAAGGRSGVSRGAARPSAAVAAARP